jgi:hypothetical protein
MMNEKSKLGRSAGVGWTEEAIGTKALWHGSESELKNSSRIAQYAKGRQVIDEARR